MGRALPSFDLEAPRPCWMSDIVEWTLGGKGLDPLYRWRVNVAPCGLLRSWSRTVFRCPRGSRLVGRRCPGCIAPRSCILAVVVHPLVEVDSPEDFELVNSSDTPMILRLPTLNLQNPAFSLMFFASP
jgi:hypothetical protein